MFFDSIVGQNKAKKACEIIVRTALKTNTVIPHCLLVGPSGSGKTTMSKLMCEVSGRDFYMFNGNTIKNADTIIDTLKKMHKHSVLYFDECHAISKTIQELLYTVMEENRLEVEGIQYKFEPCTVLMSTTHEGKLNAPLRNRFKFKAMFEDYTIEETTQISYNHSKNIKLNLTPELARAVANTGRLNPRITKNHTEWVKTCAISEGTVRTEEDVYEIIALQGYTREGLSDNDVRYLDLLKQTGKPVGLDVLSKHLDIEKSTITEAMEPWLIKQGLINIQTKGRILLKGDYARN